MEADIFRVAHAEVEPTIWIDSDHLPPAPRNGSRKSNKLCLQNMLSMTHSVFLLKKCKAGTPFINNSIFLSGPKCPVMSEVKRHWSSDSAASIATADNLSGFGGPGAYTRAISELISQSYVYATLEENGLIRIDLKSFGTTIYVGDLFRFVGSRDDFPDIYGKNTYWEYKGNEKLNWRDLGAG